MKDDHLLKAQLGEGQRIQYGGKGAVQAQQLHTEVLNEYLAADEAQQDGDDLPEQAYGAVAHGFVRAVHIVIRPSFSCVSLHGEVVCSKGREAVCITEAD